MDAVVDYSYKPLTANLESVKETLMNRAVRVKKMISEVLSENYSSVETKEVENNGEKEEVQNAEKPLTEEVTPVLVSQSVDESKEVLDALNGKVHGLRSGKPSSHIGTRAVLFTKKLADTTGTVTEKWFGVKEKEEAKEEAVSTPEIEVEASIPKEENTDIIPNTWEMPNLSIEPEAKEEEETKMPEFEAPSFEMPVDEPQSVEMPKEDPIPSIWNKEDRIVPEPASLPVTDFDFFSRNEESTESKEFTGFENNSFVAPPMPNASEVDDIPSKAAIMARVKRASDQMKDKDSRIIELETKLSASDGQVSELRGRVNSYETVTRDLAKANNSLKTDNDQLKQKIESLEARLSRITEDSAVALEKQKQQSAEELATLKSSIEALNEKHAEEKETLIADSERRLSEESTQHRKEMKALYSTISEILGESKSNEEEFTKVA